MIFSKSLPIIFISYNWLPNSRCIELIFLNSNSFFCIPQCSMEENCLAPEAYRLRHESPNFSMESRRLLRFTTSIQNIGDADFRPFIPKTAWEWHACHMHYHSMEVSMNAFLHIYHTGSFIKDKLSNGEHICDTYITETDTTELEILSHNIIDIFIIET